MKTELTILRDHAFISRKDFRELLGKRIGSLEELKDILMNEGYMDLPDWKEAMRLLSRPDQQDNESPETKNHVMERLMETSIRIAPTDATVLILGESGVGKSRLARRIHQNSPRKEGPFVTISCGSIPDSLLESELFGVEKGAFTGALKSRPGRFLQAHQGTIFLDEVGELSFPLQVKLLRVIQEKKIEPLGSDKELDVDVRIIAATNKNLEEEVEAGRFRTDLFFRLNVVSLLIPPLRERPEDIPGLAQFFLNRFSRRDGILYDMDDPVIRSTIQSYDWPGNIRELENCLERMCALAADHRLSSDDFPDRIRKKSPASEHRTDKSIPKMVEPLEEMEIRQIERALQSSSGNLKDASEILGIHRNTLTRKLARYRIRPGDFKRRNSG